MSELLSSLNYSMIEPYLENIWLAILGYIPNILLAILIIIIWFKIVKIFQKIIGKVLRLRDIDPMVESFLGSLIGWILKILVFVSAAGVLWVKTDSFVAALAAAGLAVWLALSGTLQNFASGIMILVFKRFKKWDYVEIWSIAWAVEEITIFNTILHTPDKKVVVMPNSEITSQSVTNYNDQMYRRIDMLIGIGYWDDIKKAKSLLQKVLDEESRVLEDMTVTIWVRELWDSSVNIAFRFYVLTNDYWPVWYDVLENVKHTFDENWISFPYPQQDVHHYNHDSSTDEKNMTSI